MNKDEQAYIDVRLPDGTHYKSTMLKREIAEKVISACLRNQGTFLQFSSYPSQADVFFPWDLLKNCLISVAPWTENSRTEWLGPK